MIDSEDAARSFVAGLCDLAAMARLERLAALLTEENARQNLIASASVPALWQRHIADSAQLLRHVPGDAGLWLDLGTGAGFPGLVIAALRPGWPVRLVESRRKRVEWLRHCCAELGLDRCEVLDERLERVASFPARIISARAFAPLPLLLDLSARFSTADTLWLLPKGRSAALELAGLPERRRAMFHVEQSLTDGQAGIIIGTLAQQTGKPS
jgi:16S rRNA (guanine527-N7)-methyltransferase